MAIGGLRADRWLIVLATALVFPLHVERVLVNTANAADTHRARKPIPSDDVIKTLPPDGGPEYNRLVFEKSPYLLQHAGNPVDWYPWGEEAFARARQEDKPIFLSIGYSTCHWCHVMEHESFEDAAVAELMNTHFISIKVDREERPDIDSVYMTVTQAMTGSGGWPMTVMLTPDKKPFFAGTYFPKHSRPPKPGMMQMVPRIGKHWKTDRKKLLERADRITNELARITTGSRGSDLASHTLDRAFRQLRSRFDKARGGFSRNRKFPVPHNLCFLLRYWKRSGNDEALDMAEKTLTAMRLGGMYDHVGFGTHRYSTDPDWLLPHFEKMLYDQALVAIANIEAYQATGKETYARTAREIFTYVLRDMTSPEGGFYSAEDADSEGEEGKFYFWGSEEIRDHLGASDADLFLKVLNISPKGNFHEQSTGRRTRQNIPHLKKPLSEIARDLTMSEPALRKRLEASRQKLFSVRENRVHPIKDDKILTDWNGLMIAALAKGGQVFNEPAYTAAATKAADFVLSKLRQENGRLWKRYRQGEAGLPAHLQDYAFMVWGLIDLYETTFQLNYLEAAIALNDLMLKHFADRKNGGFFLTADDGEKLLVRSKQISDSALPSGNSVAALNLLRLGRITAKTEYEEQAVEVMRAFSGFVSKQPSSHTHLLLAVDFAVGPSFEIVIAGKQDAVDTTEMLRALRQPFISNKVVLFRRDSADVPAITKLAPFTETQKSIGGVATAYVCQNFSCQSPTTDLQVMLKSLGAGP